MDDDDVIGGPPIELQWQDAQKPVSILWLARAFKRSHAYVKEKLRDCPTIDDDKYEFSEAASYLVTPRFSREFYLKALRKGDLPPALLESVWAARLKEQTWRLKAGELWRSEDVVEIFGEIQKRMKTTLQLFADTVEQEHALTEAQRNKIVEMTDGLMRDMHAQFVEMAQERSTASQVAEHPDE